MRILLIEDNADIALGISDYFEQKNHIVDAVGDGTSGLRFALAESYDVVVLDLTLPGIDGLTLCTRLRQAANWTPVLMLTARDTLDDRLRGFDAHRRLLGQTVFVAGAGTAHPVTGPSRPRQRRRSVASSGSGDESGHVSDPACRHNH